jgi:hypothetical protein
MNLIRDNQAAREDRPDCPGCTCEMNVLRIEPAGDLERWFYRCPQCARETSRLVEPLTHE